MPFLVINAVTYDVVQARLGKPIRAGGSSRRSYSGDMRSTVKIEKRAWTFDLLEMNEATFNTLYDDTKEAQQVTCSGDALLDASAGVLCEVELDGVDYAYDQATFLLEPTVTLVEV